MSKFVTSVPVDVARLIARLPSGSYVHEVTLNADRSAVDVLWDHDDFQTKVTFPTEWPAGEPPPAGVVTVVRERVPEPIPGVSRQTAAAPLNETPAVAQPRTKKSARVETTADVPGRLARR